MQPLKPEHAPCAPSEESICTICPFGPNGWVDQGDVRVQSMTENQGGCSLSELNYLSLPVSSAVVPAEGCLGDRKSVV